MRKVLLYACLLMLGSVAAMAQDFSYIYIQGDKKTPIYVKVEGNMAPRYGKNYAILPQLAPGPTHVTVLFQQNAFPAQNFTIMVPQNSSRSFVLTQTDGSFSLYDLDQRFFLRAGNTIEEDDPKGAPTALNTPEAATPVPSQPATIPVAAASPTPTSTPTPTSAPVPAKPRKTEPEFLDNVSLNRSEPLTPQNNELTPAGNVATNELPVLRNSDCPEAMPEADFQKVYRQMLAKEGDEERTSFLLNQKDNCFATWQLRVLTAALQMDAARFSVVNKLYSRVSDQQNFPLLDDLFREPAWQQAFQKLINP